MGRPPKSPRECKTERLSVALTADELDRVCRAACAMRMDVSEFVRMMCIPGPVYELVTFRSEVSEETQP